MCYPHIRVRIIDPTKRESIWIRNVYTKCVLSKLLKINQVHCKNFLFWKSVKTWDASEMSNNLWQMHRATVKCVGYIIKYFYLQNWKCFIFSILSCLAPQVIFRTISFPAPFCFMIYTRRSHRFWYCQNKTRRVASSTISKQGGGHHATLWRLKVSITGLVWDLIDMCIVCEDLKPILIRRSQTSDLCY